MNGEKYDRAKWHYDQNTTSFQFRDKAAVQVKTDRPLKSVIQKTKKKNSNRFHIYLVEIYRLSIQIVVFVKHLFLSVLIIHHHLRFSVIDIYPCKFLVNDFISIGKKIKYCLICLSTGHWYGEGHDFNLLSIYSMDSIYKYDSYFGEDELLPSLMSWIVNASHAELLAQAYYLGFSMWREPTYPLVSQTILTNRQQWIFGVYQLNTIGHFKPHDAQTTSNVCWVSPVMK